MSSNPDGVAVDKLVRVLLKMREARSKLKAKYEEEDGQINEAMEEVKGKLLELCESLGTTGLKTSYGTVSRTVKTRYWTTDWSEMHKFCVENAALDLLERRIHQTNMKTFLEEHPETIPPGLNADSKYDVIIRRK
jgi:hypothetical protein